ncbi:hypothetical protein H6P81_020705 [Aristolochia fimbriata]|uniref:Uncharacterized protein n=1 Tax=Aristolochia fimbriata TaxID=158543 RepID=A0AAV7DV47_ARIFI|nr:hypothetical protein H6P81_020705 [Aristolochia fimbriata]
MGMGPHCCASENPRDRERHPYHRHCSCQLHHLSELVASRGGPESQRLRMSGDLRLVCKKSRVSILPTREGEHTPAELVLDSRNWSCANSSGTNRVSHEQRGEEDGLLIPSQWPGPKACSGVHQERLYWIM